MIGRNVMATLEELPSDDISCMYPDQFGLGSSADEIGLLSFD